MAELPSDGFPSRDELDKTDRIFLELHGLKDGDGRVVVAVLDPMNLTEEEWAGHRDWMLKTMSEHLANRSGIALDDFDHLKLRWNYASDV